MDFLVSFYIFCIAVSEIMGAKTTPIINNSFIHLNASVAMVVFPFIFTINDIIVEVYGPERARSVIRSGLVTVFFILVYSLIAVALPPSLRFKSMEPSYDAVFGLSVRISLASLIAFAASDFLDLLIFVKMRKSLGKSGLWLRNNVSNFVSSFVDTVIFMTVAFYALDKGLGENFAFLASLTIPYWLLKCAMSVLETPLVYLGVKWLKE